MSVSFVRRCIIACMIVPGLLLICAPTPTSAHPLGNFTVNQYSRLDLAGSQIQLLYIVDMAEIPTFQEMAMIDTSGDGEIQTQEGKDYLARQQIVLQQHLSLAANGQALQLVAHDQQIEFPLGQGGLKTLRMSLRWSATVPAGLATANISYADTNYADRLGWHEIVVRAAEGATLLNSSVASEDRSQELRSYPRDLLQSPLDVRDASFSFTPGAASALTPQALAPATATNVQSDRFAALINSTTQTPAALLGVLLAAFGLGAAHALAPGHGKTVVAAYLVGSRGTTRHAIFLGLTTTITHTIGVFALGLITLFVSQFILPEQLYPWLGVLSGLVVVVIGLSLLHSRWQDWQHRRRGAALDHDHDHLHDHDHADGFEHTHIGGIRHSHVPAHDRDGSLRWRSLLALGVSGGIIPCPSALVVLLAAIALGRVGFGLVLILVFSIGLASVLTAIGLVLVHARRLFERLPMQSQVLRVLPMLSALVISVIGAVIVVQTLGQTGLF